MKKIRRSIILLLVATLLFSNTVLAADLTDTADRENQEIGILSSDMTEESQNQFVEKDSSEVELEATDTQDELNDREIIEETPDAGSENDSSMSEEKQKKEALYEYVMKIRRNLSDSKSGFPKVIIMDETDTADNFSGSYSDAAPVYSNTPKHGYAYDKLSDSDKKLYDRLYDYSLSLRTYKADGRTFLWANPFPIKTRDRISQEERDEIWKKSLEDIYRNSFNKEQQKFICAFEQDHGEFTWFTSPVFDFQHMDPEESKRNHYHMNLVIDTCREYIKGQSDTPKNKKRDLVTDINKMNQIANNILKGAEASDTDYDKLKYGQMKN